MDKEALYYEPVDGKCQCHLCPRECLIAEGKSGSCFVRKNVGGRLWATNYGKSSSIALDPIEKKPLFHFYPGRQILSLGTIGCNLHCQFCQNWQISQQEVPTEECSPERAVEMALRVPENLGLAYTYNEPLIWYEFVLDTSRLARQAGLKNVLVTNGVINREPLEKLLPYVDAMNIDLKGFNREFYRKVCGWSYEPVLNTISAAVGKCHVEVTTLLIPGHNDELGELGEMVAWLAGISPDMPLHFSRYFPNYHFRAEATSEEALVRAREVALKKMNYVYVGNVSLRGAEDTYCKGCGKVIIERRGYWVGKVLLDGNRCRYCGTENSVVN